MKTVDFAGRFEAHVRGSEWGTDDTALVVGVSGGLDSMTLLYLLRFTLSLAPHRLLVAHVDHRMRPGSERDAAWLAGVCRAWAVPFRVERAAGGVGSEAEGRNLRHRFFHRLAEELEASAILTGHTADDQAETVLFRAARGAGPAGLVGIRPSWPSGIVRPFLPFWRADIRLFAKARGVPVREDPTNRDLSWARNRIRHQVLPALERAVPGASRSLAALAETARSERDALVGLTDWGLDEIATWPDGREGLAELPSGRLDRMSDDVLRQLIRRLAARQGVDLSRPASVAAVEFIRTATSGKRIDVGGGLEIARSFDRVQVGPGRSVSNIPNVPFVLEASEGSGQFKVGERPVEVRWGRVPPEGFAHVIGFSPRLVERPLQVRSFRAGDRIRLAYGEKKLKKLFAEKRVPHLERGCVPVLTDEGGAVLWIPGIATADAFIAEDDSRERLYVGIRFPIGGDEPSLP